MTIEKDHVDVVRGSSTRRDLLKLAGAAAVGAAGATAFRAIPVAAAGSGNTIDIFAPMPFRVLDTRSGHGPLTGGLDFDFGPFPATGGFDSTWTFLRT